MFNFLLHTIQGQTSPTVITKTNGNDILTAFGSINIASNRSCTFSISGTEAGILHCITNSVVAERILQNAIFLHNLSICFRRSKMLNSLNIYIYCNFFYLLLAATVAEYGSKMYVFSDAVPRNDVTIRYIQAMQSEKDLTISLLLTGQCKQKRSIGKYLSK